MLIGAVGSAALHMWQALKDSGGSNDAAAKSTQTPAAPAKAPPAPSALSDANAKTVSDLKSLLIGLQSDTATGAGSRPALHSHAHGSRQYGAPAGAAASTSFSA